MQKKFNIIIFSLLGLLVIIFIYWWQRGDALFVQPRADYTEQKNNQTIEIDNNDDIVDESLIDDFNFTGSLEMHICNSQAICHRGDVVFAAGDVITIVNTEGLSVEVADSTCDSRSCFVEDLTGQEWDLVFINE